MSAMKRITITDDEAVKRLNLMAAMLGISAVDLATGAANTLWEEKKEEVLSAVGEMSPLTDHLPPAETVEVEETVTEEQAE